MSRIGKLPIIIPNGVEVKIDENGTVSVKGPKGELSQIVLPEIKVSLDTKDDQKMVSVAPKKQTKNAPALWGLYRNLIANMIQGVTEGFEKKLKVEGVGYKADCQNNKLILNVGFSHSVEIEAPPGITFSAEKNVITVSGIDKQLVGQVAADIRARRKPEPYKGTGIMYFDEVIRRKAGKKVAGTE